MTESHNAERRTKRARARKPASRTLKAALVLIERFGLDGKPGRSLEEVSARYGMSRLSVRTLEGQILRALRGNESAPKPRRYSLTVEAQP